MKEKKTLFRVASGRVLNEHFMQIKLGLYWIRAGVASFISQDRQADHTTEIYFKTTQHD